MNILERVFKLKQHNTTVRTETIAGITTFATMAYIIFVQPAMLAKAGMDPGAVMVATCISAAVATLLMALLANYPVALAPAMGHNAFFTYTVVIGMGIAWQTALGAVFISGMLFLILALFGLREKIVNAIPASIKNAIAVGIGLFIAFIGLQWSGIVTSDPVTFVTLGNLQSPYVLFSIFGLIAIALFMAIKVKGAILWGILATALVAFLSGATSYTGIVGPVPDISPTLMQLNIKDAFSLGLVTVIFVFFFLDLFDTVGTLVGVTQEAGLMKDGKLPKARQALLSDAIGTVGGAALGTSTVTSYLESAAGVAAGGRTGLASVVTATLFIVSLFFYPLVRMISGGFPVPFGNGSMELYPIIAPALIIVGLFMLKNVRHIDWNDFTEALPAFLTIIFMPFAYSITEGIAIGFIAYAGLKLITGKGKSVHPLIYIFAVLFILRYIFLMG